MSEVNAACTDPDPGRVTFLENSCFYTEDEGVGKDAEGDKIRLLPRKARSSMLPLPRWPTSTAAMPSAQAEHLMHARCQFVQLGMRGKEVTLGLIHH